MGYLYLLPCYSSYCLGHFKNVCDDDDDIHLHLALLYFSNAIAAFSALTLLVLPFWYRLTRVVLEKGPLNGRVCVYA